MDRSMKATEGSKNEKSASNSSKQKDSIGGKRTIESRLAQYIDRVRNLETENNQRFIKEIDDRLNEQHEAHTKAIEELRDQYETQLRSNRAEVEALMETKIRTVQNSSQRDKEALSDALKELNAAHNRIDESNAKVSILEQVNSSLHDRIRDLQSNWDGERVRSEKRLTEINRLREEMALQLEDYQDLIDIKNTLSLEIAAYDKLLSGAENRLKLSPRNLGIGNRKRKSDDLKTDM